MLVAILSKRLSFPISYRILCTRDYYLSIHIHVPWPHFGGNPSGSHLRLNALRMTVISQLPLSKKRARSKHSCAHPWNPLLGEMSRIQHQRISLRAVSRLHKIWRRAYEAGRRIIGSEHSSPQKNMNYAAEPTRNVRFAAIHEIRQTIWRCRRS